MTRQLQSHPQRAAVVPAGALEDPFATVISPAKPALDAVMHIKPSIDWVVAARERSPNLSLDVRRAQQFADQAADRLRLIPPVETLRQMGQLFSDAERIPAPEAWLHLAIGVMLSERPNAGKVSPTYRFGIVDSMLYDEEYAPGFSQPVVVRALRELRKASDFVPSPAEVLKTCKRQKRLFQELQRRTEQLIFIRQNAEAVVAEDGRQFEEDFGPWEEIQREGTIGTTTTKVDDNSDCPF
jgi:hypothetical protein